MNRLSQFWQELKRRNVVRVLTVYAGAAFVVLELADIIADPLKLPSWFVPVTIVLLSIGFIIAIILSWIYDIHPEGGMVKTTPADLPKASNRWKVASYISFAVIIILIVLNVVPRAGKKEILEKSIAVLPFRNDSPDEEKMYFINGTMEAILDNLCKIEDLRVVSRMSVEQYREIIKPMPVIAQEMNVRYVLEGSGQKVGNRILLSIQLLDARNDRHLWSRQYDREILQVEELIDIPREIAQFVATEIQAIITPQEEELMRKSLTTSLDAYDFYQRGREEYWKYKFENDTSALGRAKLLFRKALDQDGGYAQAYTGLAWIYYEQYYNELFISESFLDSLLILTDKALSYDSELADAHTLRGIYYREIDQQRALNEFNRALQLNPNDWIPYWYKASVLWQDGVQALENYFKAAELNRGQGLSQILFRIGRELSYYGFYELKNEFLNQAIELSGDSIEYFWCLSREYTYSKDERYITILKKVLSQDPGHPDALFQLAEELSFLGEFEESLYYFEKALEQDKFPYTALHRIGYAYWQIGDREKAEYYFNKQLEYSLITIELERYMASVRYPHYDLAGIAAFHGEKDKAFDYLEKLSDVKVSWNWFVNLIKIDPMFDNIREEPEFQQIVGDIEAKYLAEHERIKLWLEENKRL